MKYILKFNTSAEAESAEKEEPWVIYVVETDEVGVPKTQLVSGDVKVYYADGTASGYSLNGKTEIYGRMAGSYSFTNAFTALFPVENAVKIDLSDSNITEIGKDTFASLENLKEVVLPSTVTSIGDYAFGNCTSLSSITIPTSVTSIGVQAFYGLYKFK